MNDPKPKEKDSAKPKRPRGRPPEKTYPEPIDASPEEIAEMVLRMPAKKPGDWRYLKD